ncbi:hypothetical protein [Rhodoblastus sp.]|uniref:hypothetical protein n=1 Tax=Rhodoblastus sp. TaxID=1962975 RepID=UPI003F959DAF
MTLAVLDERSTMPPAWRRTQTRAADLAWAQHRNEPVDRIPESARREVRNWKRDSEPAARSIIEVIHAGNWRSAADVCLRRGALARVRERGLDELRRRFDPAAVEAHPLGSLGQTVTISFLSEHGGLGLKTEDPSFAQRGVIAYTIAVARFRRDLVSAELVSVEFPDHCLARMWQRSPGIDASRALTAAASVFMKLPIRKVVSLSFRDETIHPADRHPWRHLPR